MRRARIRVPLARARFSRDVKTPVACALKYKVERDNMLCCTRPLIQRNLRAICATMKYSVLCGVCVCVCVFVGCVCVMARGARGCAARHGMRCGVGGMVNMIVICFAHMLYKRTHTQPATTTTTRRQRHRNILFPPSPRAARKSSCGRDRYCVARAAPTYTKHALAYPRHPKHHVLCTHRK